MQLDRNVPPSGLKAAIGGSTKNESTGDQMPTELLPPATNTIRAAKIETETKSHNGTGQNNGHYDWPVAGVTLLLVVVTAYLVRYTKKLWGATDKIVIDAKETSEKELRAYVFIESGAIEHLAEGQSPLSKLYIRNYGKTPAHKLMVICGIGLAQSFEGLPEANIIRPVKPMGTLAPGALVIHGNSSAPITLTQAHIKGLVDGTSYLFVYGEIRYEDFTGQSRVTRFRTMYNYKVSEGAANLVS